MNKINAIKMLELASTLSISSVAAAQLCKSGTYKHVVLALQACAVFISAEKICKICMYHATFLVADRTDLCRSYRSCILYIAVNLELHVLHLQQYKECKYCKFGHYI